MAEGLGGLGALLERLERYAESHPGVRYRRLQAERGAVGVGGLRVPPEALKDGATQDVVFRIARCRGFGTLHRGERRRQVAALDVDARQRDGEVGLRRIGGEAVLQQPAGVFQLAALEVERDQSLACAAVPGIELEGGRERF